MIKDNLLKISERIKALCSRINKEVASISIIAVSKNRSVEQIRQIVDAGIINIGENRVQEATIKYKAFRAHSAIKWHLVGHLQTNKVKEAVKIFDLIQSVDSLRLAREIDQQANKIDKIQDILVQVNTSAEATKYGFDPSEVIEALKEIKELKNISVKGLMTIGLLVDDPEKARPCFKKLREIGDKTGLEILSMGMSDDFEIAIEEGANMIRIGRGIFDE